MPAVGLRGGGGQHGTHPGRTRSLLAPPLYFGAPDEGVTMWLDNVMCEGDETSLLDCPRHRNLPVGVHNCRPSEAVGVRCTMTPLPPHVTGPASVWALPTLTVFPLQLDTDPHWDSIDVVLQYRAPVTVDTAGGTPALSLLIGNDRSVPDNNVLAPYAAGSGSTRLLFCYFLPESFGSPGPVRVVRNSLHTRGGHHPGHHPLRGERHGCAVGAWRCGGDALHRARSGDGADR